MNENKEVGFVLNPLLEAQRKFSVIENRLFYLGLQDINPHLTENDKFYDKQFPDTHINTAKKEQKKTRKKARKYLLFLVICVGQ